MHTATLLLIVLSAGLASQWVAWRIHLPAIVVLITSGLLLGPVSGIIQLELSQTELTELIGLGVAIILFEGGMDLKLGEVRRVGHGVGRLTIVGPPLAWILGALAAHFVAGLSWPVSWVMGAILVVTGPTVILPLLRQARLNTESSSLLKWEGIVNDPVGVLLAVLTFQYFTLAGSNWSQIVTGLGAAVAVAALLGGLGGWLIGWFFRRGGVPPHLKAPLLMVLVLAAYWTSNLVQHEAGLLTVTVMGLVIGNMKLVEREPLRHFKENLTVVLLSVLFIIIPSQMKIEQLEFLDLRVAAFVLTILLLVRPLTIALATLGAPMRGRDKLLLAWIAPRGIVAAATAGIFGPALVAAGYPDAEVLLPLVFLIIIVTVLAHGLTLGPLARKMSLAAQEANGLLVVGASPWSLALAQTLKDLKVDVVVTDGSYQRLKPIRMNGIKVYYGEILSEHAEHELDNEHLSYLLCATDNHFYNALVCKAQGAVFGHHRTFQLAPQMESDQEQKRLTLQQRGYFAFEPPTDFCTLQERLEDGWTVQSTRLSEDFDLDKLKSRLGEPGDDWLLLGSVSPQGTLQIYSSEQPFKTDAGWTLLYFSRNSDAEPTKQVAG
ncbi:sodium:proton antiporter [Haliea sp. E1-2-M8]|uniref:cation:proton antiporter n=1 Tax=Haliea sp. E1-2-M8 TaxID=3064706 RepID=UPI002720A474|nr:sodium:proton antiporter [Haliea sp. E1-2-M8]MDO8862921.1 sodium:proton antiporter [Haliea sp. E1-2-M8]